MSAAGNEALMRRAIALARQALTQDGAKPFAAVVVKDGEIVGEGVNRAVATFDPTSHGEVEAIRDACRRQGTLDLSGCDLYTTCEPCALCVSTMRSTGIARVFYASKIESAARVLSDTVPDLVERTTALRREAGRPIMEGSMPASQLLAEEGDAVLADWSHGMSRQR